MASSEQGCKNLNVVSAGLLAGSFGGFMNARFLCRIVIACTTSFSMGGASMAHPSQWEWRKTVWRETESREISLPDKLRYGMVSTIMLAEVPGKEDVHPDPTLQTGTVRFKILQTLRGKASPYLKVRVSSRRNFTDMQMVVQNIFTPGRRFFVFLPADYDENKCTSGGPTSSQRMPAQGCGAVNDRTYCTADFEATPAFSAEVSRLVWKTENAIGKTLPEILQEAAEHGNKDAQQELTLINRMKPESWHSLSGAYPEDFEKTPPEMASENTAESKLLTARKIDDLNRIITRHPDDKSYIRERAAWYMGDSQWDKAIADFTRLMKLQDNVYEERSEAYVKAGKYKEAIQDLGTAIKSAPDHCYLYELRARACYFAADYSNALADISKGLRLGSGKFWNSSWDRRTLFKDPSDVYFMRGCVNFKLGNLAQSAADFSRVIDDYKKASMDVMACDAYAWRALVYKQQNKEAPFRKDLLKAKSTLSNKGFIEKLVFDQLLAEARDLLK
jgi:tetratricopeptide (TPR) repeat protein